MRWFLIILLFSLLFVFAIHPFTTITYDIGAHLTAGKIIVTEHHVIRTNFFSYTYPDFPFINHHWFGAVLLYIGYLYFGLKGLIVMEALIFTAAFALSFLAFVRKKTLFLSIIIGVISIFTLLGRLDVRPEIFSYLFLGWYLFVLFRKPDSGLLWSLPIVQFIWINTHILFFLGPLIYTLFLFGRWVDTKTFPTKGQIYIGGLVLIANIINPFGLAGALYPFRIFDNYGVVVSENIPPFSQKGLSSYPPLVIYAFGLGIFFTIISFIANHKNIKKNIFNLSLFIISSILAIMMIRNMPIFALCMLPIVMKNIHEARWFISYSKQKAIIFAVMLAILIYSVIDNEFYSGAGIKRSFGLSIPPDGQKAVDFVQKNNLTGPILNSYNVGSFLIWQLPNEKIFIDGRPEAYPADFIKNVYIGMQIDPKLFEKYSEQYKFNYIFWDNMDKSELAQRFIETLKQNPKWFLAYEDNKFRIFIRNTPENHELISR